MSTHHTEFRPAPVSSIVAVLAAAAVILALAQQSGTVSRWLGVGVVGLAALALGVTGARRSYRLSGGLVALLGGAVCVAAVGGLATTLSSTARLLAILPGVLGLFVVGATLVPLRGTGSRLAVKVGAGGVFACVLFAGLFQTASLNVLLGATLGTVLVWDAGEHAIGVGEQLGRRATTWRLEVTHLAGTALVGLVGALSVGAVDRVASGGLSLAAFLLVFLAVVLLLVALRS